jgi:hypothetical protein
MLQDLSISTVYNCSDACTWTSFDNKLESIMKDIPDLSECTVAYKMLV